MRFRPTVELLESRETPSRNSWLPIGASLGATGFSPRDALLTAQQRPAAPAPSVAAMPQASGISRWDWLANTAWYVPAENLLAYMAGPNLANPVPVGDQTLWHITSSQGGVISGDTVVQLGLRTPNGELRPDPMTFTFQGIVTRGGNIRITFTPTDPTLPPTTGVGQMRWVDGAWRMQMQMASGSGVIVTHWAYMSQLEPGVTPGSPFNLGPDANLLSTRWRWLRGTRWTLADTALGDGSLRVGNFQITGYRNGYFWGVGRGSSPFTVLGSVTPEGNVFLSISVDGQPPVMRTGQLTATNRGWTMLLRTYDGTAAVGWASILEKPTLANGLRGPG